MHRNRDAVLVSIFIILALFASTPHHPTSKTAMPLRSAAGSELSAGRIYSNYYSQSPIRLHRIYVNESQFKVRVKTLIRSKPCPKQYIIMKFGHCETFENVTHYVFYYIIFMSCRKMEKETGYDIGSLNKNNSKEKPAR